MKQIQMKKPSMQQYEELFEGKSVKGEIPVLKAMLATTK